MAMDGWFKGGDMYGMRIKEYWVTDTWRTALSLPGSVTEMHTDFWVAGQVMQHLDGEKIWLLWPQTQCNISMNKLWNLKDENQNCMRTMIKMMPDLLVYFVKEQSTFVIPPWCRHAVLTIMISCHSGVPICIKTWRMTIELMKMWIFKDLRALGESEEDKRVGRGLVREVYEDVKMWMTWLENKQDNEIEKSPADLTEELEKVSQQF
ncbi:hypothetical protein L208DRAFT_1382927 [Tricholoma matsutake]|nr:hypothetical protein L208DRAFT_1382927 [Tricholoma matsutake 945]